MGWKIPLPRWSLYPLGTLAVLALALFIISTMLLPIIDSRVKKAQDSEKLAHYQRHFGEPIIHLTPLLDSPEIGKLEVGVYASDRCVVVNWRPPGVAGVTVPQFFPAANYSSPPPPPAGSRHAGVIGPPTLAMLAAVGQTSPCLSGRCLNPHPGRYSSTYPSGRRNGAWAEICWRWPDGCVQGQWRDDRNGSVGPLYWICCNH